MPRLTENLHLIDELDLVLKAAAHEIDAIFDAERRGPRGDCIDGPYPAFAKGAGGMPPMVAWAFRRTRGEDQHIVLKIILHSEGLMFLRCSDRQVTVGRPMVNGQSYTTDRLDLIHQIPLMDPKFFEKVRTQAVRFTELYDL